MNQSSGLIVASFSSDSCLAIGVFFHRLRRCTVIVRVSSRDSDFANFSGRSFCRSATSHLRLVHAALLTEMYIACQRRMTYVAVGCGGS